MAESGQLNMEKPNKMKILENENERKLLKNGAPNLAEQCRLPN